MTDYRLTSKQEADSILMQHFQSAPGEKSAISVREDRCFKKDGWLNLGAVILHAGNPELGEEMSDRVLAAVHLGFFEWECIASDDAAQQSVQLMVLEKEEHKLKAERALDSVASVAVRIGLIHPLFDADAIAQMPFRRPTTVVADTSGILQGGLDFVVRFLYPMARLKVPAIAHMEILNSADNYFKYRRAPKITNKARALFEHANSQGGQRALLRLELQTDAEIERGRLGSDPLRGVIQTGSDAEDTGLGLQNVQRSFVDRLIFETARQHLSQSSPDHPVTLLTADQGLARMTLGEGMQPLFFEATSYRTISGRKLSGTIFNPFSGRVYAVSLTDLLWELAVTFGMSRLVSADSNRSVEICAMGDNVSWQPYHAKDDLLWLRSASPVKVQSLQLAVSVPPEPDPDKTKNTAKSKPPKSADEKTYAGAYKFSVAKLFTLIESFATKDLITEREAFDILSIGSSVQLEDYRNFLLAGGFVTNGSDLHATEKIRHLFEALRSNRYQESLALLRNVKSFALFIDFLQGVRPDNPVAKRALSTYTVLSEIIAAGFDIPDERVYATPTRPAIEQFTKLAFEVYEKVGGRSDRYVLTGMWLEGLVREAGIHPLISRELLEEARKQGLLDRFTEGSTPETRYQNHTLYVLDLQNGHLNVRKIGIFEGDFLLPGKSSVSIRLKRGRA